MPEPSPARRLVGDAIRLLEDDPAPAARILRRAANLIDPAREQEQAGGELEQAVRWAVRLEQETAHLEESRDEYVEALRGATARVFEERRKILPIRLERDLAQEENRYLRELVGDARRREIDLEEALEARDAEIGVLLDRLGIDEVEYLRADVADRVNRAVAEHTRERRDDRLIREAVDRVAARTRAHEETDHA